MSHVGVRLLATQLADATNGVNAMAALVPRLGTDAAPPTLTIYNETQHGWVARGQVPKPQTGVVFPCVIVYAQAVQYDSGVPDTQDVARTIEGTLTVVCQLLLTESHTETAVQDGMYLLRALRGAVLWLDDPNNDTLRTGAHTQLRPSMSVQQGQLDAPVGDTIVSGGALVIQYPFIETTPLTPNSA